jgi:hypothetical protein
VSSPDLLLAALLGHDDDAYAFERVAAAAAALGFKLVPIERRGRPMQRWGVHRRKRLLGAMHALHRAGRSWDVAAEQLVNTAEWLPFDAATLVDEGRRTRRRWTRQLRMSEAELLDLCAPIDMAPLERLADALRHRANGDRAAND